MPKTKKMFKQTRVPYLGELVDSIFTAMPALSLFAFISTLIILYETVKKYFIDWVPWLSIWYFFGVLAVVFVLIMLFVFKYVLPSIWHFRSTQMGHLEKKIDAQTKELAEIKELLEDWSATADVMLNPELLQRLLEEEKKG